MTYQRYQVTLIDSGTYTLTVAAANEGDAVLIAREVLHDQCFTPVPGLEIVKRTTLGEAKPDAAPAKPYRFQFEYVCDYSEQVQATDHQEARRLAEWLIKNHHPLDFDLKEDRTQSLWVKEVVS